MKFSTTLPALLASFAATSVNGFAPKSIMNNNLVVTTPVAQVVTNNAAIVVGKNDNRMMPLKMVASQEIEVNRRKKTKEVRNY